MDINTERLNHLQEIGLSRFEAEVYIFLLKESPSTGYNIAKKLGKAAPNIYPVLDSLIQKGAVNIDDFSNTKKYYAVNPDIFSKHINGAFIKKSTEMAESLKDIKNTLDEEFIQRIPTESHVFEVCSDIISRAEHIIFVEAFPETLERIKPSLEKQALKGVHIVVTSYRKIEIKNCTVALKKNGEVFIKRWKGQWLNIVADHRENIQAFFHESNKIHEAVWMKSPYLSTTLANGMAYEFLFCKIVEELSASAFTETAEKMLNKYSFIKPVNSPGYNEFIKRFEKHN